LRAAPTWLHTDSPAQTLTNRRAFQPGLCREPEKHQSAGAPPAWVSMLVWRCQGRRRGARGGFRSNHLPQITPPKGRLSLCAVTQRRGGATSDSRASRPATVARTETRRIRRDRDRSCVPPPAAIRLISYIPHHDHCSGKNTSN
jgi:hypothetical protein